MIRKIISGGLEGVERAALDVALKLEIPHGGWIPKGCRNAFPNKFNLKESSSLDYGSCREKNIVRSDATLFLLGKNPDDDFNLIKNLAKMHQKPFLSIDFRKTSKFESALAICKWIMEHEVQTLHVTGERGEIDSQIYTDTMDVLESAVYLGHVEYNAPLTVDLPLTTGTRLPKTLEEAVGALISDLPLKDRVMIANMTLGELGSLNITLGKYIRETFGLWGGNADLMESCRIYSKDDTLQAENASSIIIKALWEKIKGSHRLRIIR